MSALLHRLRDWLAEMIDGFAPAKGAPPRSLWPLSAGACLALGR